MVEITERENQRRDLLSQLLQQRSRNDAFNLKRDQQSPYTPKGREVYDTVEISDGAKMINLKRGLDLARDIVNNTDPDSLREQLKQGSADISRIGKLFRAVFSGLRFVFGRFY
ncbi:MAG: hypothetical protein KAH11_07800 [Rhodospirillales bacterium]|nr:hypothetical protein [Rhodospirillales bacterium]